jgi:hypothetical protein
LLGALLATIEGDKLGAMMLPTTPTLTAAATTMGAIIGEEATGEAAAVKRGLFRDGTWPPLAVAVCGCAVLLPLVGAPVCRGARWRSRRSRRSRRERPVPTASGSIPLLTISCSSCTVNVTSFGPAPVAAAMLVATCAPPCEPLPCAAAVAVAAALATTFRSFSITRLSRRSSALAARFSARFLSSAARRSCFRRLASSCSGVNSTAGATAPSACCGAPPSTAC